MTNKIRLKTTGDALQYRVTHTPYVRGTVEFGPTGPVFEPEPGSYPTLHSNGPTIRVHEFKEYYDTIQFEYLRDYENSRDSINPVDHLLWATLPGAHLNVVSGPIDPDGRCNWFQIPCAAFIPSRYVLQVNSQFTGSLPFYRAFQALLSGIPDRPADKDMLLHGADTFSIYYPIVDLLLLGGLLKQVNSAASKIGSVRSDKRLVKDISSDYLAFKFGVQPLISDIGETVACIKRLGRWFDDCLAGLTNRNFHHRSRHFTQESVSYWSESENVSPEDYWTDTGDVVHAYGLTLHMQTSAKLLVNSAVYYRLVAPDMLLWGNRLKQIVDSFGLLDPAAVWDVIPFSFILDWFSDLGGWLNANKPRLTKIAMVDAVGCRSHHVKRYYRFRISNPGGLVHDGVPDGTHGEVTSPFAFVETYQRRAVTPNLLDEYLANSQYGVTAGRGVILSAMAGQRFLDRPVKTNAVRAKLKRPSRLRNLPYIAGAYAISASLIERSVW